MILVWVAISYIICVGAFMYGYYRGGYETDNAVNWSNGYDMGFADGKQIGIRIGAHSQSTEDMEESP